MKCSIIDSILPESGNGTLNTLSSNSLIISLGNNEALSLKTLIKLPITCFLLALLDYIAVSQFNFYNKMFANLCEW